MRGKRFERGDLRYAILSLLDERPAHGYELIRSIEERFGGFYSPSPGAVYPTLQLLEDQGFVTVEARDGKKIYTITESGKAFLADNRETVDEIWGRFTEGGRKSWKPDTSKEMMDVFAELRSTAMMLRGHWREALDNPEKVRQVRDILARTRADIDAVFKTETPAAEAEAEPEAEPTAATAGDGERPADGV
jgi:DNA-binding PadR family transcriptional regulator